MWLSRCNVVDVRSGSIQSNACVEVADGKVVRIDEGSPPTGAETLDMRGRYLLPGLISCHAHLTIHYPFSLVDPQESPARTVLRAAMRAKQALEAGVTTLRCVGEQYGVDVYLREAQARGWVTAPRILAGGEGISTTGGHGSTFGPAYANGSDGFLAAARQQFARGANHIKIYITGGLAAEGETLDAPQMTSSEMAAAVQAAAERRSYVAAHAASSEAISLALEAGVRCFEHGYFLDAETAGKLASAGAFLSPTLCVTQLPEWMQDHYFTTIEIEKFTQVVGPEHRASVKRAIDAGVTLVNGTDFMPGEPSLDTSIAVREMELMVDAGLSPLQSIQASTINAAVLCQIEHVVGTIEPGLAADLVTVAANPLQDIRAMRDIVMVMQAGNVVRFSD
jgi:imidazolonepropionase-like amidohydrolase